MERLGPSEPHAAKLGGSIDNLLDIREKLWCLLYLVDEHGWVPALQKERGVLSSCLEDGRVIERHVGTGDTTRRILFHKMPEHGGLTYLTRTNHHDDLKIVSVATHERLKRASDVLSHKKT